MYYIFPDSAKSLVALSYEFKEYDAILHCTIVLEQAAKEEFDAHRMSH